ncbi:putative uncharacterized protein C1orf196 [Collichthys lucidus]|uniref:Uncharacterized protein n=1 Tax=Collichthys lucidus TaxID=240159 RepID=A0A4U5UUN4_COLLU|nr:putative uncharacterized protein C1orf196 [Collichthys lucidus]
MEEMLTCSRSPFSQVFGRQGQLMQARSNLTRAEVLGWNDTAGWKTTQGCETELTSKIGHVRTVKEARVELTAKLNLHPDFAPAFFVSVIEINSLTVHLKAVLLHKTQGCPVFLFSGYEQGNDQYYTVESPSACMFINGPVEGTRTVQSLNSLNDQIASFMVTGPKPLEQEEHAFRPPEKETLQKSMTLMRHLLVDAQTCVVGVDFTFIVYQCKLFVKTPNAICLIISGKLETRLSLLQETQSRFKHTAVLLDNKTVWVDKAVMLSLTRCVLAKKNGTGRHMELTDMTVSDRTYTFPFSVDENAVAVFEKLIQILEVLASSFQLSLDETMATSLLRKPHCHMYCKKDLIYCLLPRGAAAGRSGGTDTAEEIGLEKFLVCRFSQTHNPRTLQQYLQKTAVLRTSDFHVLTWSSSVPHPHDLLCKWYSPFKKAKILKMMDDNKQLAQRIDGAIQSASQEVTNLRSELSATSRRLAELGASESASMLETLQHNHNAVSWYSELSDRIRSILALAALCFENKYLSCTLEIKLRKRISPVIVFHFIDRNNTAMINSRSRLCSFYYVMKTLHIPLQPLSLATGGLLRHRAVQWRAGKYAVVIRNGPLAMKKEIEWILQRPPSEAEMRRTDETRGSGEPEIDQNQTGVQSTGGHREGRNVGPIFRMDFSDEPDNEVPTDSHMLPAHTTSHKCISVHHPG